MKVAYSHRAQDDLAAIALYIAQDNPVRAESFADELRAHCDSIGDAPLAHAVRGDLGRGIRCCPHGNYLIFYRVARDEVLIVRIIHSARDVRQLARRGDLQEPAQTYAVSDFEALGFLRVGPPPHDLLTTTRTAPR